MQGSLLYSTDLFRHSTMQRMAGHLATLLASVVAAPNARISHLELMDPAERELVVRGFNNTAAPYPADACIHNLFEAAAAKVQALSCALLPVPSVLCTCWFQQLYFTLQLLVVLLAIEC